MTSHSDSEPDDDMITIASKKVVICRDPKPTNPNKQNRPSTITQKMTNDSSNIFEMTLATDGVAMFGD